MYIVNGICYAGEMSEEIEVVSAKPLDDMMMLLQFSNGELRLFDATILKGAAFEPLALVDVFRGARVEHGVVTWMDGDIDCAPEYMYANSYPYDRTNLES